MRFVKPAICLLLFCIGCSYAYGQDPYYVNIGTTNGLPSNAVYFIMQDSKGFMWIAHDEGLSRYDGHQFKTYTSKHQTSKPGTNISEDKTGRIWYQNFDGYIYFVENDSLYPLPKQKNPAGFTPYGILDSVLITISQNSINLYDIYSLKLKSSIKDSTVGYNHAVSGNDKYYATFGRSIFTVTGDGRVAKTTFKNGYPVIAAQNRVINMDRGNFDGWAYEFNNGINKKIFNLQKAGYIQSTMFSGGDYWFCTTQGAFAFRPDGTALNNGNPFFKNKNLSNVCRDKDGNYWFGTINEGVLFVPDLNTRLTEIPGSLPSCILADKGNIYIATNKTEVYVFNPNTYETKLRYKNSMPHEVLGFKKDAYHDRYLIVAQSLNIVDKNFNQLATYERSVKDIIVLNSKYYAFSATGVAGLFTAENNTKNDWDELYRTYDKDFNGTVSMFLINERFKSVEYNPFAEAIYFAGNNGLYKATASDGKITELTIDGTQIYATQLKQYNRNIFALTPRNTLLAIDSNDNVKAVNINGRQQLYKLFTVNNQLLVLTSSGVKKYDSNNHTLVSSEILKGIRSEDIRDISSIKDTLIIATNKGIITSPASRAIAHTSPRFHITSVVANKTKQNPDSSFTLRYNENNVEVSYALLAYQSPDDYLLHYKINNGVWTPISNTSGSIELASLSPGSYTVSFLVGEPGSKDAANAGSVSFIIENPYWATTWFWILCVSIVSILVFTYYKWQTGILKKQNQLLTEKVQLERNLHKSVLTSIRSQMNPHFFYNALNTIQSFIVTDDKRNASTYLSKFSKLTRTILEMTGKESVTLSEEMNALKLYLDLEKVRFNNEFHYTINVINGLDVDMVKIPSMIVQPYVENSIKHGLLHKSGEKILLIDFLKRDNNLSIIIDDNGIGRKKSSELNKIRKDKHKPFATEANMKRIEILNKGNNNIGVVYTDKTDAFGQSNGTIVTITIPLIKD